MNKTYFFIIIFSFCAYSAQSMEIMNADFSGNGFQGDHDPQSPWCDVQFLKALGDLPGSPRDLTAADDIREKVNGCMCPTAPYESDVAEHNSSAEESRPEKLQNVVFARRNETRQCRNEKIQRFGFKSQDEEKEEKAGDTDVDPRHIEPDEPVTFYIGNKEGHPACLVCYTLFPSRVEQRNHQAQEHSYFECRFCDKSCSSKIGFG